MDEKTKARLEKVISAHQKSLKEAEEKPARDKAIKEKFIKESREFFDKQVIPVMEDMKKHLETQGFSCSIVDEEVEGHRTPGQYDWRIIMHIYPGKVDLRKPDYLNITPFIWFSAFKLDQSIVILAWPKIAPKEGSRLKSLGEYSLDQIDRKIIEEKIAVFVEMILKELSPKEG